MTHIFYGFLAGMIIGLVAAGIITAIIWPPTVAMEHLTLDGQPYDCVLWADHAVCDAAGPNDRPAPSVQLKTPAEK